MTSSPSHRPLAVLLGLAVAIKAIYLVQYLDLPIFDGPAFDSLAYLRQARAIRVGRFGDASLVAFSPLYGYALALTGGPESWARMVSLQLVLGCFNLVLVYQIVERLIDRRAAIVSASLYLGYGLLAFYETKVLAETLGVSLSLLTLVLCTRPAAQAGQLGSAVWAGVAMALAVLARSNLLLVAPLLPLVALFGWERDAADTWTPRWRRALGFGLGIGLVLGANGLWNASNTGVFVPVILRSATASRASTTAWDGKLSVFSSRPDGEVGVFDVIAQAEARLSGKAPSATDHGIDLWGVVQGAPRKLQDTFRSIETDFPYGYYGERSEVPILGLLSVSFGLLSVLSLLGVCALSVTGRLRVLWPLLPWALGATATTVLFHPSSRYRLPIVLPMLVLSGAGVGWLWSSARDRRFWLVSALTLSACGYFTYGTLTYRLNDPAMWQLRMAESAIAAWDSEEAERRIARAQQLAGDKPHIQRRIAYLRQHSLGRQVTHQRH